jgi:alpha-glucosidase
VASDVVADPPEPWWRDAVGYEVYVPSFADSDGDGWGDLPGVASRLDYLADLGVDLVWLSPIHPSPFADHGYDVADYLGVDPRFGTVADAERLVAAAADRGIRVLLDLVPNHTSVAHEWFRRARRGRDDPYRDYYIWRDPAPDGGPPNNWVSAFGGPAWTLEPATGQYYLHLFAPGQPDLDWRNPAVAEEFDAILRTWLDRGFAGFRIDVPHVLRKHPDLLDNPRVPADQVVPDERGRIEYASFEHRYDRDQPDVVEVYARWREVIRPYGGLLLGEVSLLDPARLARHTTPGALHACFWFGFVRRGWDPDRLPDWIRAAADTVPGLVWVLSSHDRSRAVTRYGGGAVGRRRALVLATLMIGLPELPLLYQGDELGLDDAHIPPDRVQDPLVRQGGGTFARDAARTPMPWAPRPGLGFTSAADAWLPLGDRAAADTVAVQHADPGSPLSAHRTLLHLRRARAGLRRGPLEWLPAPPRALAYRRGDCVVAANLGAEPIELGLPDGGWTVAFATGAGEPGRLGAEEAAVLTLDRALLAPPARAGNHTV